MRARFGDRVDHDAAFLGLELVQLFLQEFGAVFGKWNCVHVVYLLCFYKSENHRGHANLQRELCG
jgi:hypothetical protein